MKAKKENRTRDSDQLREQADQLRSRMAARVPVKGSLSFLDSRGTPHAMGIDVGKEQSMKEPRSHIEGATPATAIWSYGIVPDPFSPASRPVLLNRKIPVRDFLPADTIEGLLNRSIELQFQIAADERAKAQPNLPAGEVAKLEASIARNRAMAERVKTEYEALQKRADDLEAQAAAAEAGGNADQASPPRPGPGPARRADHRRDDLQRLPDHQGQGRRAGLAEIQVTNPRTGADYVNIFPIKEYYTNQQLIGPRSWPARWAT